MLPLIGFLFSAFGRYFGRELAPVLSVVSVFFSFLVSVFCFYEVCLSGSVVSLKCFTWILFESTVITFGLLFDSLTCVMLLIVTGISFLVHLYSLEYMLFDPHRIRFVGYLSLFTFFMLVLVTADNYLQMFVGWEGVGLCSYLLINFWFTRILANKAALKAMIMNRIADVFFCLGIVLILLIFKTCDYLLVSI